MLKKDTTEAIEACIKGAIPFACYMRPHETSARFLADNSPEATDSTPLSVDDIDTFEGFLISTFGVGDAKTFYGIRPRLTEQQVLSLSVSEKSISSKRNDTQDTPKDQYLADVEDIIRSLSGDGEKAVYARQKTLKSDMAPTIVADTYFAEHPGCFRFLYYTPATGLWLGASPELLVDVNYQENRLSTMALAGTRAFEDEAVWSPKNQLEHNIVVDFISNSLTQAGSNATICQSRTCRFGAVEHLATPIEASPAVPLSVLINTLSPTPALCGWPTDKAASLISSHEHFDRLCYGGTIGECTSAGALIYVNLRSVEITTGTPNEYRLIAGGGITVNSDPEDEWMETVNKMKSLTDIIAPAYITRYELD